MKKNAMLTRSRYSMLIAIVLAGLWPASALADGGHRSPTGEFVEVVREATRRFHDVSVAEAAGYALHFGCVSGSDVGAMGLHYAGRGRRTPAARS